LADKSVCAPHCEDNINFLPQKGRGERMENFLNSLGRGFVALVRGVFGLSLVILNGIARGVADAFAVLVRRVGPGVFGVAGLYAFWRYNPAGAEELMASLITLGIALFGLAIILGYRPGKSKR